MPKNQMPLDASNSSDNSSLSSNENIASSRTTSSSDGHNVIFYDQVRSQQMPHFTQTIPQRPSLYEPKLDELLSQASGTSNLDTLSYIQLRVTSNMFGLHRLNVFLPALVALNLDGSSLNSLRDLGDSLNLRYLNVSRCGLRNFDGISGLNTIQHLVADENSIRQIAQLSNLHDLCKLSLRGNQIDKMGTISFLACCSALQDLDLTNNPISTIVSYRSKVKEVIPQLLILDSHAVSELATQNFDSDKCTLSEYSSLSSASKDSTSHDSIERSESNAIIFNRRNNQRPFSSHHYRIDDIVSQSPIEVRPSTAGTFERRASLTTGDAIVGTIITKARKHRRHKQHTSNSSSSTNSTSSMSSSSKHNNLTINAHK